MIKQLTVSLDSPGAAVVATTTATVQSVQFIIKSLFEAYLNFKLGSIVMPLLINVSMADVETLSE